MEKKNWMNLLKWLAVCACTMVCMILVMAEPLTENASPREWLTIFIAMKAGAVISGAVALGIAGKLKAIMDTMKDNVE